MKQLFKIILSLVVLSLTTTLSAQQLPHYTHYWANAEAYNPAYSGIMENGGSLNGIYRSQWDQLAGAPETQLISLILPNYNHRVGIGMNFHHDKLRPQRNLIMNASLGYQAIEKGKTKLTLGASIGLQDRRSELTTLNIINSQDAQFFSDDWRTHFNLGIGAHLYSDKWFIDAAIPNVVRSEVGIREAALGGTTLDQTVPHHYFGAGYKMGLSDNFSLYPKVQFKFTKGSRNSLEFQAPIGFKEVLEIGPFIRIDDAVGVIAAIGLMDNQLKLGYAYGASTTKLQNFNNGSHELGLRFLLTKPSDIDEDGIPDQKDSCPQVPGLKKYDGCPDTDLDGIIDAEDGCPQDPGPIEFQGCPDADGDGIVDKMDNCPEESGPKSTMGCPDRDGDGVIDNEDECPDVIGSSDLKGCPDGDRDGIADRHDDCPTEGGDIDDHGCPLPLDSDGDGLIDDEDDCPEVSGTLNGCPDSDGDGIRDLDDKCPEEGGNIDAVGCPKPVIPIVQNIGIILFDTDKNLIKKIYNPVIEEVINLMMQNADFKLVISGHTDNIGGADYNMTLSKRRAESIQRYIIAKGISKDQVGISFSGEDSPRNSNANAAERKQNRRVEFTISDGEGHLRYRSGNN